MSQSKKLKSFKTIFIMAMEIERKFLIKGNFKKDAFKAVRITQGYICSTPEHTVRIRLKGDEAYITIKGIASASGASRFEWEQKISPEDAARLLEFCESGIIDKTRYLVKSGEHVFEVDEFHGDNDGLVIAEVELRSEDEPFVRPEWLGEEVTGDERYYNSMLSKSPYKDWKQANR